LSKSHYIIPIFVSHQGCPYNCVFCNQNSITGSEEMIDGNYVHETIKDYLDTINRKDSIVELSFFGGTFTAIDIEKQRELLSVAKYYKDLRKVDLIRLSTRPDYIDIEILDHLKHYSVDIIELGVQSMDNEVLLKSGRGHTSKDVINASRLIKEYGFIMGHQVMLGLPGDTPEKDIETVRALVPLKPDLFRIYPALVIKDTPMERLYRLEKYIPYTLEKAVKVTKEIYSILIYNKINIIRVGLQATDNINIGKDVVAGPFHPAFRELVEGSLICDMILDFMADSRGSLKIFINEKDISKLYANKKQFFNDMKKQLNTINIDVYVEQGIKRGVICLKSDDKCCNVSINDYINKRVEEGKINIS
jgi:histone acetyltransferase (RNA polymerase elongator complex component)